MKKIYVLLFFLLITLKSFDQSVSYISFDGSWDTSKGMVLTWSTSQETRNNVFVVQRTFDLSTFTNIGEVASKGSGIANRDYTFIDVNPSRTSQNYYRLQAVDLDGKFQFTQTKSTFIPPETGPFVIYDDQIGDVVTLGFTGSTQPRAIRIIDLRGTTLLQQELIRSLVVVKTLLAGVYIMEVTTNTGEVLRKRYLKPR